MAGPDPFAGFTDQGAAAPAAPPGAAPAPAQASDDPYGGFEDAGPNAPPRMDISRSRALVEGFLDTAGFGFRDEIKGLSDASGLPSWIGGFRAPIGAIKLGLEKYRAARGENQGGLTGQITGDQRGPVEKVYEKGRDETRHIQKEAEAQQPGWWTTGQVGGAVIAPGGAGIVKAPTTLARAVRSAKVGAAQGGLYGVGSGENLGDRATRGAVGTAIGGTVGAVASPVVDLGVAAVSKLGPKSIYQALRADANPAYGNKLVEDTAARRVHEERINDFVTQGPQWTPETIAAANRTGIPTSIADTAGEGTLALARSSANQSPEARAALKGKADETFAGQVNRAVGLIRNWFPGADNVADREAIQQAARAANRPAYQALYAAGDRDIWSPELERLTAAPTVQSAMRQAIGKWRDWQVVDGFGAMNPPVSMQGGRMVFGPGGLPLTPNIQFWDYTARVIADKAEAARRAGKTHLAAQYGGLERQLKAELDTQVPQFADTRAGAARFFGARDALEAGQNFVHARGENSEFAHAIRQFTPEQRDHFARGFAATLADSLRELRPGQNILTQAFVTSPASVERIQMALGPERARQFEAYMRAEQLVDRLREALGNSTTARQLTELGLIGAGTATLGHAGYEGEWDMRHILGSALLLGSAYGKHRAGVLDRKVAQRIGEMLASHDHTVLQRGTEIVGKNQNLLDALRIASDKVDALFTSKAVPRAVGGPATNVISSDLQGSEPNR